MGLGWRFSTAWRSSDAVRKMPWANLLYGKVANKAMTAIQATMYEDVATANFRLDMLKDKAQDVRATSRLVDSPACLVVKDGDMSTQLARMLRILRCGIGIVGGEQILMIGAKTFLLLSTGFYGSVEVVDLTRELLFFGRQISDFQVCRLDLK